MSTVTLQELLEAGTHFGHQTKRWNPKMKRYILCARNGIYIIDLNKTVQCLDAFLSRVRDEVSRGGNVLFVGTKKQVKDCIREEAERCGMPYVSERWLGGMLTNFQTIRQSIARLEKIEAMESDGTFEAIAKKERLSLLKKKEKLLSVLSGIRTMRKIPRVVFIVDVIKENIAVDEARRLKIPIGAIVDTNCDPEKIDFPIPGNDDAIKSVQLIAKMVADMVLSEAGAVKQKAFEASPVEETQEQRDIPDVAVETEDANPIIEELQQEDDAETKRKPRIVRHKMLKQDSAD